MSLSLSDPDGFSVLTEIQKEKKLWCFPVLTVGAPDAETERKALEMGADDFAGKPHFMLSLLKRLQRVISAAVNQEKTRMLEDVAYKDHLTGVLNRRGMEAALKTLSRRDLPLAVYIFDLDNLKNCNDTYGHAKGDQMLAQFGQILRAHTRENDILARVGGDEFVAVVKQMPSAEVAAKKGEEICRAVRACCSQDGVSISCSGGVVMMEQGDSMGDGMEYADRALYRAKKTKKGSCCLWKEKEII